MEIQSQHRQIGPETLSQKTLHKKGFGGVAQGSNPNTTTTTKKKKDNFWPSKQQHPKLSKAQTLMFPQ
jgi:hypothetical protein